MRSESQQLEAGIAALLAQRGARGDAVVDASVGLHRVEAHHLSVLGRIAARQNDDVALLDLFEQTLAAMQAAGDQRAAAAVQGNLGIAWLGSGELIRARRELDEGLRLMRANGDRASECGPLCALSNLASDQADADRALSLARIGLQTAVATSDRRFEAVASCLLGSAELALGRHDAAAQAYRQARELAIEIGTAQHLDASAGLARVALAQSDTAAAILAIEPLLALAAQASAAGDTLDDTDPPCLIELTCHQVLAPAPAVDPRAADWLRRAHERVQATAARMTDSALREGFLQNIPHRREVVAAWARRGA